MDIQTREAEKATIVSASGKIDAMTAPAFESSITEMINDNQLKLVIDLGRVEYISSAGLRVILSSAKSLKAKGGMLLLADARGPVREVLDISGFGSVFIIYDSVESAVESTD